MQALLALFLLQAPGDGWALLPSPPRQVQRLHWELFHTTEVWVRLLPEGPGGGPPLVHLIFQAYFPEGAKPSPQSTPSRWPRGDPARIALKALPLPLTAVGKLTLQLDLDGRNINLTRPGSDYRYLGCPGPGENCAPSGIEAELEPSVLQSLITAKTVLGEALGFPMELTEADRESLQEFARRIGSDGKRDLQIRDK